MTFNFITNNNTYVTFVNLGTCENPAPPNVSINNLTSILPSGRYPDDGSGIIRCPNGFTLYGRSFDFI